MSIEQQIRDRITDAFTPGHIELDNESHMHSVPADSETHFRLVLVSGRFAGKRPVARHQLVYGELAELLAGPVHALAMHLYDNEEWAARQAPAPESPACHGGSKADAAAGRS